MSVISKLTFAAALALSFAPTASHAAQLQNFPKQLTPRYPTFDEMAIVKTAKVVSEDTLKYIVESTDAVCGEAGKPGANVKVVIRAPNGKLILLKTYGVPEDGVFTRSTAVECK